MPQPSFTPCCQTHAFTRFSLRKKDLSVIPSHVLSGYRLKCNREKPCQNCIVRGESAAASCTYVEKPNGKVSGRSRSDAAEMRSRIMRLESSIRSIIAEDKTQTPSSSRSERSTSNFEEDDLEVLMGGPPISTDSRSTHWDAVLHEVSSLLVLESLSDKLWL